MKKIIALSLVLILVSGFIMGCSKELNSGADDIAYNDIVYKRSSFPNYNIMILSGNEEYIGDFAQTYDYGQVLLWEVFVLNSEKNVLYSDHAVWVRPGYEFPDEYGEEFFKAEHLFCEGILDEYREEITLIDDFKGGVKLEDIISSEPTELEEYTQHDSIRFYYSDHADMAIALGLFSSDGVYYLSVCEDVRGDNVFFEIKEEYVEILTSAIVSK